MNFTTLSFSVENHVATITLNRPESGNAMNLQMAKELMQAAIECDSLNVRVVIITGSGSVFSVGGDLKTFLRINQISPPSSRKLRHISIQQFPASPVWMLQ